MNFQIRSFLISSALLFPALGLFAMQPPGRVALPNFDRRTEATSTNASAPIEKQAALEQLRTRLPRVRVDFDPVSRSPKFISAGDQFLSASNGQGKAVSAAVASRFAATDPYRPTRAFVEEHRALFGHGPEALDKARVKRAFVTPHNGLRTVVWEQAVDGIPLFESELISHTTSRGELVNVSSQFLPDPETAADRGATNRALVVATPKLSARQAVVRAAQDITPDFSDQSIAPERETIEIPVAGPEKRQFFTSAKLKGKAEAKLIWLPMGQDRLRLCWDVILMDRSRGEMFRVLVDVQTGEPLVRRCLTDYLTEATYRVYTSDSPSPFSPSYQTAVTNQPPLTNRVLVTLSALNTNASPNGWINDGGNETLGNNVDAHTDRNADNVADLPRPHGSPARVFDFPLDLAQAPAAYTNAAVVQLFYWNNFMHDKLYELGFTEAAGNFQSNNFARGGLGNDAVQADAQDGSGVNNANFSTPPDGSPGRMQMYIFTGVTPNRDGDLDAEVILHEYTHGLSNRRVGGGVGISALQSGGMGEGWSDFYAMALLSSPDDDVNAPYASGGYVTYLMSGLTQNYYFGIRRYPYCTDMTKNPLTFKDIDPLQASSHTGIPRSPIIGTTANEVHNMGEVWCMTLREARANLIMKYGWAIGNQLILQLVTDGMNLSPANPNFLQTRDAILQADQVDTGGANQYELWSAFAKRGMGFSATSPVSSTATGVVEAFNVPLLPLLVIVPPNSTEGAGILVGAGRVQIQSPATSNIVVTLSSSKASEVTVPATVTIPAGQTNAAFNLTIIDDAVLDGTQTSTITGSATGYATSTTNIAIFDNETATLSVVLPGTASEGQGTVSGTVQVSATPSANVTVSLFSSDTTEIQVPATAIIPAGQTSGTFTATVVDDNQIDGAQTATVTAHVQNWTDGGAAITVLDNENTNLTVLLPLAAREGDGVVTNAGSVRISGTLPSNLVVTLASDDTTELTVPTTTTILAGQTTAAFNLTVVDDPDIDGAQMVHVTANAAGFVTGAQAMIIYDNESPPVPATPSPAHLATNVIPTTGLAWQSGAVTGEIITNDVYFGTNPTPGQNQYVGTTTSTNWNLPMLSPLTTYYWQVVARKAGTTAGPVWQFTTAGVDHFTWNTIPSPQYVNQPFSVTVTARDAFNNIVSNYTGPGGLSASSMGGSGEVLRANFETGLQGFTVNNTFGLSNGLWHLSTGRATQSGHSPTHSLYYGKGEGLAGGGTYSNGVANEGVITSATINLSAATAPLLLSFNCLIQSEPGTGWDHATVELSTNNGTTYGIICGNNQGGSLFGTDSGGLWMGVTNDISSYAGKQIQLRLHFNTIDSILNNYEGWYVDDLVISSGSTPVTITPVISSLFTDGTWTGYITAQQFATNVVLQANDGNGHTGSSNPFSVVLTNDISVSIADSPDPVSVGAGLTYTLKVANTGPQDATGVIVTNVLPSGVNFISATSSQGACIQTGGVVIGNLGLVPGGTNATITIMVVPTTAGTTLTNSAAVVRTETEGYLANNLATAVTTVTGPAISIGDASVVEGNVGTTNLLFAINLAAPSAQTVTVNYATANGSASTGSDYIATNGILSFAPGVTNGTIKVALIGDTLIESNETFTVNLSAPVNGVLGRSAGIGTIINDDGFPGQMDHFSWNTISSPQFAGQPFGVLLTAKDASNNPVSNFNDTARLNTLNGGGLRTNMILGNLAYSNSISGTFTLGYAFTPNTNLTVTHVRSFSGTKVSIWTDAGVLLASQSVSSIPGTWVETPLTTPLQLNAGSTYRVAFYSGGTTYYWRYDGANTFADGVINQSCEAAGDAFPAATDSVRWWFVDLRYQVGTFVTLPVTPTVTGAFTNGFWAGDITVQQAATNVVLQADDGNGHTGASNPFSVGLTNDLSVSIADSPDPVSVGAALTYTLKVVNTGPLDATGVTVTNVLPAGVNFVSATSSQGACTQTGGVVIGNLGLVPGGTNATVTIVVMPTTAGTTVTNSATVSRTETESYLGNNLATAVTTVTVPAISIADASVVEGNVGTTNLLFAVNLAAPSIQTVSVSYATSNGGAIAGSDYVSTNGILTFAPGITNGTIRVTVTGDTLIESNETFTFNLSAPVNGVLVRSAGVGTIINDDGFPGQVDHFSWSNIPSPQYAGQPFAVTIGAQDASNSPVTNFNGTVALSGFANGNGTTQSVKILSFILYADTTTTGEYHHTLTAISNYVSSITETSTITTDATTLRTQLADQNVFLIVEQENALPGALGALGTAWSSTLNDFVNRGGVVIVCSWMTEDHFILHNSGLLNLARIASATSETVTKGVDHLLNQGVATPFIGSYIGEYSTTNGVVVMRSTNGTPVVITRDIGMGHVVMIGTDYFTLGTGMDRIVANATSWAQVSAGIPVATLPVSSGNFVNGVWTGNITVKQVATNLVLQGSDGNGHTGSSNPINVTNPALPVILLQPAGKTVLGGSNVVMVVTAGGTPPLSYFWQKNTSPLPGETNTSLVFLNVMRTNSGSYRVSITNYAGSITSSNATLLVHVPQRLGAPVLLPDGTLTLNSSDLDGGAAVTTDLANMHAQASTNLTDWTTLSNALILTNGVLRLQDPASTNAPARFYRIIENW